MSLTVFDCNDMRLYSPIANVFGINQYDELSSGWALQPEQ